MALLFPLAFRLEHGSGGKVQASRCSRVRCMVTVEALGSGA